jgi:hypothetical protein
LSGREFEDGIVEELVTTDEDVKKLEERIGEQYFDLLRDLVNKKIELESGEMRSLEIIAGFEKKKALCYERIEAMKLLIVNTPLRSSLRLTSQNNCNLGLARNAISLLLANISTFDESIKTEYKVLDQSIDLTRTEIGKLIEEVKETFNCDPTVSEFFFMLSLNN